jgi:hypothetical protein
MACARFAGHPYRGFWGAMATMHGKEIAVAPPLCRWFDMAISTAPGIDTDELGTFTGEVARQGTMVDAARAKAKLAIERTGAPLGIGSEGAFGPDPLVPFMASGQEVLLLHEASSGHEIWVHRRTATNFEHAIVSGDDELDGFLARVGFPEHAVVVMPENGDAAAVVVKGLRDRERARAAIREVSAHTGSRRVMLQSDMRAHLNPTRMSSIGQAARRLALKIARCCPRCGTPGFGLVDVERGRRCRDCETPTRLVLAEIHGCSVCGCRVRRHERSDRIRADPMWCDYCNP